MMATEFAGSCSARALKKQGPISFFDQIIYNHRYMVELAAPCVRQGQRTGGHVVEDNLPAASTVFVGGEPRGELA
jgi:hypothetical protein